MNNNTTTFCDKFGFLFVPERITFDLGTIIPLPSYHESENQIRTNSMDIDGKFLFPPIIEPKRRTLNLGTGEFQEKKSGPQRAAHLWKVPSSHELCLNYVSTPEV